MSSRARGALGGFLAACLVALAAACGSDSPTAPVFEVIEDAEFATAFVNAAGDTIPFDLGLMTRQDSTGVYTLDRVVGTGDTAVAGDSLFTQYTGWLRDGTQFDAGSFVYRFLIQGEAIPGYQFGMLGQQAGGTRFVVIPPEWAYGSSSVGPIYAGAIVVFEIQLDSIRPGP